MSRNSLLCSRMPDDFEIFLTSLPFAIIGTMFVMILIIVTRNAETFTREEKIKYSLITVGVTASIFMIPVGFFYAIKSR